LAFLISLSVGQQTEKEAALVPVSSLPIAENGEKDFGQAAKRQACTSCLWLDHISRYGS